MPVRQEIIDLVNALTAPVQGDPVAWAVNAAEQSVDVLAAIVASLDEQNKEADLAALQAEAQQAAMEVAAKVQLPWGADIVLPGLAGGLVKKLGDYSGRVEEFKTEYLLPTFTAIEAFGHRGRVQLGGA